MKLFKAKRRLTAVLRTVKTNLKTQKNNHCPPLQKYPGIRTGNKVPPLCLQFHTEYLLTVLS